MSDINLQTVGSNGTVSGAEVKKERLSTTETSPAPEHSDIGGGHGEDGPKSEVDLISEDGYGFDYVMVFKTEKLGVMTEIAGNTIRQIMAAGLHVRVYFGCSKEEIFCEIRVAVERLMEFAHQVKHKMLLDEFQLADATTCGDPEANIAPISITHDPDISSLTPFEYIYARYDMQPDLQKLYFKSDGMWHPFRSVVRLNMVVDLLKTPTRLGGAGLKVDKMKLDGRILALFPKHFKRNKNRLRENWLVFKQWPWDTPYDEIKDYYGEKIGLYFCFLGHLTTWLFPLAAVGVITATTVYATGNPQHPITLAFAPIVVLWGIGMLEYWKRKEKRISLEWGMVNFEDGEQDRPEYEGAFVKSHIDGRTILFYPDGLRLSKARRATGIIITMILVVVSCIAAVYAFRWYLVYGMDTDWGRSYGGEIASIVNSVQIHILDALYKKIAVYLTDFENHRTATEYEDSLIAKLFSFSFCNSYGGFIYLAFIGDPVLHVTCETSCMTLLATNLGIVFVVKLVIGNLTEVLIPYIKYIRRVAAENRHDSVGKIPYTQAEKGYVLEQYDPVMGTLMDYAELAVEFGYITLFVVAFPLAPLLALGSFYVEARSDAFKLLTQLQRPVPHGAEDIGSWQYVFTILTCISVVTNSALICLVYEDLVGEFALSTRLWLFILIQWSAFMFMAALGATVPDTPEEVTIQLQRTEFLSRKMVDKISDEEDDIAHNIHDDDLEKINVACSPSLSHGIN